MNSLSNDKICLIALESRRSQDFSVVESACRSLASCGYYADEIIRVAYDSSDGIVKAFQNAKGDYANLIVLCPQTMGQTVLSYLSSLYCSQFDLLNVLKSGGESVFVYYYDCSNRLNYDDIKLHLDTKYERKYEKTYIRACCPPDVLQSAVAFANEKCDLDSADASFNISESFGDYRIEIVYSSKTPKMALDDIIRAFVSTLGEYVYALEDITLPEQLFRLLKLRRMKIAAAESFTGGGVGKALVDVPGISEVYSEGLNTYSNEAKIFRLGVKELTLKQYGAVSADTAYEMAEGLLKCGNCDIAISTTGIAGPKSDNTLKPVGLAYIGVGLQGDIAVYKFNFVGNRESITQQGINQALYLAYKRLK